jgi:hypothetical protein
MLAEPDTRASQPATAQSENNCDAPVWWPERRAQNPIPSRTRPLNTPAPMVLCLKARESRSPPDLPIASAPRAARTEHAPFPHHEHRSSYQLGLRCFRAAGSAGKAAPGLNTVTPDVRAPCSARAPRRRWREETSSFHRCRMTSPSLTRGGLLHVWPLPSSLRPPRLITATPPRAGSPPCRSGVSRRGYSMLRRGGSPARTRAYPARCRLGVDGPRRLLQSSGHGATDLAHCGIPPMRRSGCTKSNLYEHCARRDLINARPSRQ